LATNDHISSSWTSRVSGGKGHQFLVGVLGVLPGLARQPHDGIAVDADEAFGLSDAVALDQMPEDRDRLLAGQAGVEQRGALPLREPCLARLAVKESNLLVFPVTIADREVTGIALAVERASRILAAEAREVVHGCGSSWAVADRRAIGRKSQDKVGLDDLQ
jgi:hypothetical protein